MPAIFLSWRISAVRSDAPPHWARSPGSSCTSASSTTWSRAGRRRSARRCATALGRGSPTTSERASTRMLACSPSARVGMSTTCWDDWLTNIRRPRCCAIRRSPRSMREGGGLARRCFRSGSRCRSCTSKNAAKENGQIRQSNTARTVGNVGNHPPSRTWASSQFRKRLPSTSVQGSSGESRPNSMTGCSQGRQS
jgi:hypothetical protein